MPFFKLTESELRDAAKRHVETLEFWLRRVVDEGLSNAFGVNYWEAKDANNSNVIKKDVKEKVSLRIDKAPAGRFPRWIDATLIEHIIEVLYNNKLYNEIFREYFNDVFPGNMPPSASREYLKFILDKIASVRNTLYHSNHISIRQTEQVVCYTNDMIESIKKYYVQKSRYMDFNVPTILSFSDSLGNKFFSSQLESATGKVIRYSDLGKKFRPGDRLKISIEVDATFSVESYSVKWSKGFFNPISEGLDLELDIDESWVGETNIINVEVISDKNWHKHRTYDDDLKVVLTVLSPIL